MTETTPVGETPAVGAERPPNRRLRGVGWMIVSTVSAACMHTSVRHVSEGIHPFEIAFFRLLFGFFAVLPFILRLGLAPFRTKRLPLLGLRGVLNTVAMLSWFTALTITPLAEATAISFTAPIFSIVLAMLVFRERIGPRRWTAIVIGFLGTMVVVRPGFVEIQTGALLAMGAALMWGSCVVIIKELSRTESSATITAYMSLVMAPMALVPALFHWTWPGANEIMWLIAIGCFGSLAQYSMTEALRHAETHVVMPVDFIKLVWVAIIAFLAFGEVPGLFVWLGGAMIVGATAYIGYREHNLRKRHQ